MKVLIVEPGQYPRVAEIENTLEAEQVVVGGLIDVVYPWQDNAGIVCNDEGKLMGLPLNRPLGDYDVLAGTFFICGLTEENFTDLTDEQIKRYEKLYHDPVFFFNTPKGLGYARCTPEEYQAYIKLLDAGKSPKADRNNQER